MDAARRFRFIKNSLGNGFRRMPRVEAELLVPLQIPRLAALATSPWPAWLWSADASRILWANAVGAAIFGAADTAEIGNARFGAGNPSAAQIARLAATLPSTAQERLERLRGFGAGFGRALMCACSRIAMADGTAAVLVAATEPAGPSLPLPERVRRLLAGGTEAIAAFAPDGALLHANEPARQRLGGATTLSALGLEALAAKALKAGQAGSAVRFNQSQFEVTATRLGKDQSRVLVLTLPPLPAKPAAAAGSEAAAAAPTSASVAPAGNSTAGAELAPRVRPGISAPAPVGERRHPLRFVWHMDADGRFAVGSDEFIELVGARTIAACGRLWSEIAAELKLDPDNQVARAIATHETWSGILISWPVEDTSERLPVELSGLPIFDRDRAYGGYRGFGVCRDVDRINQLARARRALPIGFAAPPQVRAAGDGLTAESQTAAAAETISRPQSSATGHTEPAPAPSAAESEPGTSGGASAANVVPFRAAPAAETKSPSLNALERTAFSELGQELSARLRGSPDNHAGAAGEQPTAAEASAAGITPAAAEMSPIALPLAAEVQSPRSPQEPPIERVLLDRVPAGVLISRANELLYANRHFLELSGYENLEALAAAGGLDALFAEPGAGALTDSGGARTLSIKTHQGDTIPVEGRLFTIPWEATPALALILTGAQAEDRLRAAQTAFDSAQNEIRDLKSSLERTARREAQKAAAAKADFLSKVSHEIRTPLNSMIGFAEVIIAERFGSIGNERYREYLKDMHAAGTSLVSLLNDLLDLSKIETGQLDLAFAEIDLNDLTQQCIGIMQPQANRARIIIRSALAPGLRKVAADARSLRQIVLNLLANAIKFTGPGGQVIVSTAVADGGEVLLRVRDTGVGMREADIEAVLEPFHQISTSTNWGSGTGLGLPLTKALAEANRANFSIKSAPNAGTLIEIAFPPNRTAAH
jgi:signal transduction histidine kinase